jgi:hypothetical protein
MGFYIFLLPFFLLPPFLSGQELPPAEPEGSYYIERTGEEARFIQRLVWDKADYVYRYEITVEKQNESGEYGEIHRESRTENFIELSLTSGLYRYRIEVYDLLNRSAGISDWISFRVFKALQPELLSFSQEFTSREGQGRVELVIRIMNLMEGAEIRFQSLDSGSFITPLARLSQGENIRLVFSRETLTPGPYRIYVRNPGGLESSLAIAVSPAAEKPSVPPLETDDTAGGSETAAVSRAEAAPETAGAGDSDAVPPALSDAADDSGDIPDGAGVYVSVEYAPLIPLYGQLFSPFDNVFYPLGASLRIGVISRRSWGEAGLELAPAWNMLKADTLKVHMGTFHVNGLYQWRFSRTTAFVFRAGAGINFLYGTNDQNADSIFTWIVSAGGGIFFRRFILSGYDPQGTTRKTFYIEFGAEYNHLFTEGRPTNHIKPALGLGLSF